MACLETTFLIDLMKKKPEIHSFKEELDKTENVLSIAAPSVAELWAGASLSNFPEKERRKVMELLQSLQFLPLDLRSAKEAGEIEAELIKNGLSMGAEDIMIAAIAKVNGEKLVTRDQHFARIPGLRVLKY